MTEADFLAALKALPLHAGALGLTDDAARLGDWVLTTDTMVEGVHFLPADPPVDIAWKLVAVNLSDLAAKGAVPEAVLLSYPLADDAWDRGFVAGLGEALAVMGVTLIGGDTVSLPSGAPRVLGLTAIGRAGSATPARGGACAGDRLYVTGTIGDAGAGLALASGARGAGDLSQEHRAFLVNAYRRPTPRSSEGIALAPLVAAMMDVSDGLLIDAARLAAASGLSVTIDLAAVPLSAAYRAYAGEDRAARLAAATAGDDYQLLFAAPASAAIPVPATAIGAFETGTGLRLTDGDVVVGVPSRLGFEHG